MLGKVLYKSQNYNTEAVLALAKQVLYVASGLLTKGVFEGAYEHR